MIFKIITMMSSNNDALFAGNVDVRIIKKRLQRYDSEVISAMRNLRQANRVGDKSRRTNCVGT